MRIISQNGQMDFPYELTAVYINKLPIGGVEILCRWQAEQKSSNLLAKYTSEENAMTAMQMLHDAFNRRDCELADGRIYHYDCLFRFPSNKEIEDRKPKEKEDTMTKEEFANGINGREYGNELTALEIERAKESGLVIVYGASDDLMEFAGAIEDEGGCFDGGNVYFDKNHVDQNGEKLDNVITAVWCGKINNEPAGDPSEFQIAPFGEVITWCYQTTIPHATFMIYEDGEPYCRGIVFSIEDVK